MDVAAILLSRNMKLTSVLGAVRVVYLKADHLVTSDLLVVLEGSSWSYSER